MTTLTPPASFPRQPPADGAAAVPPGAAGIDHVIGLLLALAQVPARRAFQQQVGEPLALKPVEFTLLVLLLAHHGAAPKQLAAWLRVPAPQVTLLVDRLAERGLLERRRSPHDGRALQIHLTGEGHTLAQSAQQLSRGMEADFLAPLSPAERAMLRELLLKLVRAEHEAEPG
jgi:DNA-binding MarR family transcriptional regulator